MSLIQILMTALGIATAGFLFNKYYRRYVYRRERRRIKRIQQDFTQREAADVIAAQALRERLEREEALRFTKGLSEVVDYDTTEVHDDGTGLTVVHLDEEGRQIHSPGQELYDKLVEQPLYDPQYKAFDYEKVD